MGNLSQKSPAAISLIGRIGAALRWQAQSRSAGGSHASRIPRYAPRPYRTRFRWPPPQRLGLKTKAPCLRTGPLFLIQWWDGVNRPYGKNSININRLQKKHSSHSKKYPQRYPHGNWIALDDCYKSGSFHRLQKFSIAAHRRA